MKWLDYLSDQLGCISGHYAAWSKQPPNADYWEEEPV